MQRSRICEVNKEVIVIEISSENSRAEREAMMQKAVVVTTVVAMATASILGPKMEGKDSQRTLV